MCSIKKKDNQISLTDFWKYRLKKTKNMKNEKKTRQRIKQTCILKCQSNWRNLIDREMMLVFSKYIHIHVKN